MKKFLYVIFMLCSAGAYTRQITSAELHDVISIGRRYGVPESVTRQLIYEESRGDVDAQSYVTREGYYSAGLLQIYTKPDNYDYLLWKYWPEDNRCFNIYDPVHNATIALHYLSDLHKQYGSWYKALLFYNHGDIKTASERTKKYALRIINASKLVDK
jgi:soluble lytic murein transglycosylase-like protein